MKHSITTILIAVLMSMIGVNVFAHDIADYIMGNNPIGFNWDAADANNDGKVNAADIVLINKLVKK